MPAPRGDAVDEQFLAVIEVDGHAAGVGRPGAGASAKRRGFVEQDYAPFAGGLHGDAQPSVNGSAHARPLLFAGPA